MIGLLFVLLGISAIIYAFVKSLEFVQFEYFESFSEGIFGFIVSFVGYFIKFHILILKKKTYKKWLNKTKKIWEEVYKEDEEF